MWREAPAKGTGCMGKAVGSQSRGVCEQVNSGACWRRLRGAIVKILVTFSSEQGRG